MRKWYLVAMAWLLATALLGCSPEEPTPPSVNEEIPSTVGATAATAATAATVTRDDQTVTDLADFRLQVEQLPPYSGMYPENGEEVSVTDVSAISVTNNADRTVLEAKLVFFDGVRELVFDVEMLSSGQTVVLTEKNKTPARDEKLQYIDGTVTYLKEGLERPDCIEITAAAEGLISVHNKANEPLPLVRVFYRSTDGQGRLLGSSCYSSIADGIGIGETVQIEAEYWNNTTTIVTVLVVQE